MYESLYAGEGGMRTSGEIVQPVVHFSIAPSRSIARCETPCSAREKDKKAKACGHLEVA